jgi:Ca-activated chloride channel family protein
VGVAVGLLLAAAAVALPAPEQEAGPDRVTSGRFLMRRSGEEPWVMAPTLATDVSFRVAGVVARASVRQRFRNGTDQWVEGVYVFPLPEAAAVDHLRMRVGERTIEGQIRERDRAKSEYEEARAGGRRASLVEQERSNVFTTSVANLGPGEELVVEIEFQQTLAFDEGEVRLRFPLVVGPRYIPGLDVVAGAKGLGWAADTDAVPDASRITPPVLPPGEAPRNPVGIEVDLDAGFAIRKLVSRHHEILTEPQGEGRCRVRLRDELVPANRDFELAWTPEPGTQPRGALYREEREGATYALVTLFPPVGPEVEAVRLPREVVYVIDTSGSMSGLSIERARRSSSRSPASARPTASTRSSSTRARRRSGTRPGPRRPRAAARPGSGWGGSRRTGGPRWRPRWRLRSWRATTRGSCGRSCSSPTAAWATRTSSSG